MQQTMCLTSFFFLLSISACHSRYWDGLKVANYKSLGQTVDLPMTVEEAIQKGWKQEDKDCAKSGTKDYYGYRWTHRRYKEGLALLFDDIGWIGGFQPRIPKTDVSTNLVASLSQQPWSSDDKYYYVTTYVNDTRDFCYYHSTPSRKEEYQYVEFGTDLSIQLRPDDILKLPKYEKELMLSWVRGKCYLPIGRLYWYKMEDNMEAENLFPIAPIVNAGELNGFAMLFPGTVQHEPYALVDQETLTKFIKQVPESFKSNEFSMFYVTFTSNPWLNFC